MAKMTERMTAMRRWLRCDLTRLFSALLLEKQFKQIPNVAMANIVQFNIVTIANEAANPTQNGQEEGRQLVCVCVYMCVRVCVCVCVCVLSTVYCYTCTVYITL